MPKAEEKFKLKIFTLENMLAILNNLVSNKKNIIFFIILFFLFFSLIQSAVAGDYGLDVTAKKAELPTETNVPTIIGKIIGALLAFIGIIFFILMIWGGYTWMMAGGNEQSAGKGREVIISAIVGLIIVLAAYALTRMIGGIFWPSR